MNAQNVRLLLAALVALASVSAWAGEPKSAPPGRHVWDHAAVARCSSTYQREIITDPQAKDGRAARLSGEAHFVSMHDEIPIAPGRNRFTIRLRLPQDSARRRSPDLAETPDRRSPWRLQKRSNSMRRPSVVPQCGVGRPAHNVVLVRRRSPDLAETPDRRSPWRIQETVGCHVETFGRNPVRGRETRAQRRETRAQRRETRAQRRETRAQQQPAYFPAPNSP